jgi:regulator of protease activity HflC (stomatin/prohibitin superfamily)
VAVRDLILSLAVMLLLQFLLGDFVRAVYGLKTPGEGRSFLRRRLFGTLTFKPYLIIKEGKLPDYKDPLMRVGGPGSLVIYKDSAVVLEQAGKLTRVVKKGFAKLDDMEKVWDVVDLRPQHWVYDVIAMSKDGIPVTCQADVTFQIDDGGRPPSEEEPFPATEQAIFYAATRKWMREADRSEDDQEFDWARRAIIGMTEGALRGILARYLLDQLLGPAESKEKGHYRKEVVKELKAKLEEQFPDLGARVVNVQLGDIKVDGQIAQQQIEAWQTLWKRWAREREAEGEAERLQYVEAAKAQSQADMIVAITQAFQSLTEAGAIIPSQLVLLRMFEVLKRSSYDPQTGMLFLPAEVLKTWKLVQDMALGQAALPGAKESE